MKNLQVSDVILNIDGELIKGFCNESINHVALRVKEIKNKTLYFDIYKNLVVDLNSIPKNNLFVVVTDNPERFKNFGDNITLVKVKNITSAYWKFVEYYRTQFNIPIIGVTGTCGKTTTKEMIKHILSSKYSNIVATHKSSNSLLWNFKYLLEIDDSTEIAAIEMGVAVPGDLPRYFKYFTPNIGVITTIGVDHLDRCKTLETYIKEKSKLLDGLGDNGTVILNADSENIGKIDLSNYKGKVIYFGFNESSDFIGYALRKVGEGMEFTLKHDNKNYNVFIPVLGDFNAYNALAAIAAAYEAGIKIEDAVEKLKSFKNVEQHLQIHDGIKGCIIIDDTWSTNPTSADASIRILKSYSEGKKTVAVLGRMNLLGSHDIELHRQLGELIAELGINNLITTDDTSKYIGIGALEKGMSANCIYNCSNLNEIMNILNTLLDENTVVLVKASMLDSYKSLINKLI